jgi:hypothetical protein
MGKVFPWNESLLAVNIIADPYQFPELKHR